MIRFLTSMSTEDLSEERFRLLYHKRKSNDPNTDPLGTSAVTVLGVDGFPEMLTCWFLSER